MVFADRDELGNEFGMNGMKNFMSFHELGAVKT
jgi:hypothetical protein